MRRNVLAKFTVVMFFVALILSIISQIFILRQHNLPSDMNEVNQFYVMREYHNNKVYPASGAYISPEDYIDNSQVARVPGGFFFVEYLLHYVIGGGDHYRARISYTIAMTLSALMFLFWLYARLGIITTSVVAALMLTNANFIFASNSFSNVHTSLMLSFFFLPLLAEYMRDRYESLITSVLICPVLALMWQAHFAAFFSIIATFIIYTIIRWDKRTRYNIKGFTIGLITAAMTYIPYLSSEIVNKFANTQRLFAFKKHIAETSESLFEPTRLHNILFFPTDESGTSYGSFENFFRYWVTGSSTLTKIIFIFYIFSILFMFFAVTVSLRDYFRDRNSIIKPVSNNDKNKNMLKEMMFFFMLYFGVTFVSYHIFGLGFGRVEHFHSAYTLSFVPIIYFIEYLKLYRSRLLKCVVVFVFINMFALATKIYIENKDYEPYDNFYLIGEALTTIVEDAGFKRFNLDASPNVDQIGKAYFGESNWNSSKSRNIPLKYIFKNANADNIKDTDATLIFESNYHKIYKVEK